LSNRGEVSDTSEFDFELLRHKRDGETLGYWRWIGGIRDKTNSGVSRNYDHILYVFSAWSMGINTCTSHLVIQPQLRALGRHLTYCTVPYNVFQIHDHT
jgi:hypothetical protein